MDASKTQSKHTPGPWRVINREALEDGSVYPCHIVGGGADLQVCLLESPSIAQLVHEHPQSMWALNEVMPNNAAFIVRACNAHEQLVAALREMIDLVAPNIYPQPDKPESAWAKLEAARATLTAAGAA